MPADTEMKAARQALAGFERLTLIPHGPQDDDTYLLCLADDADTDVARVWGTNPDHGGALARLLARAPTALRAALARVDELEHLEASQHKARARDVAAIVGWVRRREEETRRELNAPGPAGETAHLRGQHWAYDVAADAIERGDWHDGTLPPDPRDARIAELQEQVARLRIDVDNMLWNLGGVSSVCMGALDKDFTFDESAARAALHDAVALRRKFLAARRLLANDYTPWESAGGPNDCPHQRSTPCPECDRAVVGVTRG